MAYTSRLLNAIPGIRHAFLDVHETAAFPYAELAPVKLVHGNEVHHYQQPLPTRPHADAVFTAVAGQKVGVVTADCLPLLIASRDGRYVCSVHAGWQGLVSGIVDNSLACFRQQGVALADLVIAVGPHIHPCCYEVSAGFYQQLLDQPGGDRVARHRQRLFHSRSGPVSDPLKAAARGSDNL
ncbi:membrane protein [Klebsiella pneumoniae]|nr:membrane protein [Klebsiella pneumoniae]